jgi:hypothetical protein
MSNEINDIIIVLERRITAGEKAIAKQKRNGILDVLGEWGGSLETNQMKLDDLKKKREKLIEYLRLRNETV